ncbi:MAG: ATP-binding protein, partial [Planctomyces sp.]
WQAARRQKQRRLRPEVRKTQAAAAKDNTLATAMIDRLMHHGEAMVIQGSSFRTKGETPDE